MIRHVSLLTWSADASPDAVAAVARALAGLPASIPEIRAYRFGGDLGVDPGNADFAIVADFDSIERYRTYRDHPAHRAVATEHILPILAARSATQYEIAAPGEPLPDPAT